MESALTDLEKGDYEPAHDSTDYQLQIPDEFDLDKFNRGRNFFKRNVGQCLLAMMMSLIVGLSIPRFLKVLVCTGMSSTPMTSLKRYLNTTIHVLKWHYGNVCDTSSSAFKSVCSVRKLHANVRKLMQDRCKDQKKNEMEMNPVYLSQYEMGLVQSGFMGIIVMYPKEFGIRCTTEDLDDYVYFWRWMGYLLGIQDKYNICIDGYKRANVICHAIENKILVPSLKNPPAQFYPMADAFVYGFKLHPFATTECIIGVVFRKNGLKSPISLSITDTLRMYIISGFLTVLFYCPSAAHYFNNFVEKIFQCHKFT